MLGVGASVAVGCSYLQRCNARWSRNAMPDDDASALTLDLAERLVGQPYSSWATPPQRARLLPGALPEGLPFDVPRPPGSSLLGTVVCAQSADGLTADVLFTTSASV